MRIRIIPILALHRHTDRLVFANDTLRGIGHDVAIFVAFEM